MKKLYIFIIFVFLLLNNRVVTPQSGWNSLYSGTSYNLRAVYSLNYQTVFVTGDGARVLKTTDGGTSWQDISPAFSSVNLNDVVFFDSLEGLVVGDAGTIYRTTDSGSSWSPITAGIGENSALVRQLICDGLGPMGIVLSPERNASPLETGGEIQSDNSEVKLLVVPTNEELEIARQTARVVGGL